MIGNEGDARRAAAIVRLSGRAAQIDPNYARAWALKGLGESVAVFHPSARKTMADVVRGVEKALALDPDLVEAYADQGHHPLRCGKPR